MGSQPVYSGSIALVGGGISGAVLAIALTRRGLNVTIYEQARKFGEIGAGVAFNPSAVRAMGICSPDIQAALAKVATYNGSPERRSSFFDWVDGESDKEVGKEKYCFTLHNEEGANAVHRAHFLDELIKLVPEGITHFAKHLDTIEVQADGKPKLLFRDGSSAVHDVVIGTDGIKSSVRRWLVGEDSPAAHPTYTHKYAYRGLIPMERAVESLGDELARNGYMHMGQDGHILTFPVNHGATMNLVAFRTDDGDWPDYEHLVRPTTREHMREDFKHFGATVQHLIDLVEPQLDCWAIFDTGAHPLETFCKGRVAVLGDAAHATSPHHGSGAGHCVEDAAVMAELLADPRVASAGNRGVEAAFVAFTHQRKARTQDLVQSSRRTGDLYEFRTEHGRDVDAIHRELETRFNMIWKGQISEYIAEAKEKLGEELK